MVKQSNEYTEWVSEHLVKEKNDILQIQKYAPHHRCDRDKVNKAAETFGDR